MKRKQALSASPTLQTVAGSWWYAPSVVRVVRDALVCPDEQSWKRVEQSEGLLERFVRLADDDDDAIAEFTREIGLLFVCAHGQPGMHMSGSRPCNPLGRTADSFRTPLTVWRRYATEARATLLLAAALRRGEIGDAALWQTLYELSESRPATLRRLADSAKHKFDDKDIDRWVFIGRGLVASVVEDWLALADLRLRFHWGAGQPDVSLGLLPPMARLFGELATQLMTTVSGRELAVCSHCGSPYVPPRKPRAGERNYCNNEACRKFGAQARASDTYRRKKERLARRRDARARGGTHGQAQQGKR